MTQKEKLIKAHLMAVQVKQMAGVLRQDARDFDLEFLKTRAKRFEEIADEYLKSK